MTASGSAGGALRIGVTCYPTFGGSGVVATEVGHGLARLGHRVHFISYDVPSRLDRFVDNVFFHEVEVPEYPLFGHTQTAYPIALASKMVEVARYERLDVLHVHYAVPHATSAYLARQILGRDAPRVVTTLHGTDITLVGSDPSFLPITRFSIMQSDAVTAPSEYLKRATYERLDIRPELPIEVIPNFVDTERFSPAPARSIEHVRHLFGPPGSAADAAEKLLIHVSNFRPLKRVDDVVRILAAVRARIPALLVLVGDGPERSRIEGMVREMGLAGAVCFLGKQQSFVDVLKNSDVFLLPSESESFGLAALEALSCGVPVVATDVGGIPEVVVDGEGGFLAPVGDVGAMAARVVELLSDQDLHRRMAGAARRRAEERWRPEPMVARYEACYRRALEG